VINDGSLGSVATHLRSGGVTTLVIGVNFLIKVGVFIWQARSAGLYLNTRAEPRGRAPAQGGRALPPEAEGILSFGSANEAQISPFLLSYKLLRYMF